VEPRVTVDMVVQVHASRIVMLVLSLQTTLAQSSDSARGVAGAAPKPKSQINWKHGAKVVYHMNRMKLQAAYCPYDASQEEKQSLPCRFYEIQKDFSKAKPPEKLNLAARRATMFDQYESKSDVAKKEEKEKDKVLYTKAYAKYCTGNHMTESVCMSNNLKKLYGTGEASTSLSQSQPTSASGDGATSPSNRPSAVERIKKQWGTLLG